MFKLRFLFALIIGSLTIGTGFVVEEWGFFGHRKINRMAVFTLPSDMISLYKKNIEYITEHAVDPDKRRYATKFEAVRHYIDIDHWGTYPFENVPRKFTEALVKFGKHVAVSDTGDTLKLDLVRDRKKMIINHISSEDTIEIATGRYDIFKKYANPVIMGGYYEGEWSFVLDSMGLDFDKKKYKGLKILCTDGFSEFGILPYHMYSYYYRLVDAFENVNEKAVLRLSAEMGHYLGDAHVPLHTTTNYNGQLTDQVGIHGFWESRLPELFADEEYDFFVGQAEYIEDKRSFFWDIILESHSLLDSVLLIEKRISKTFPQDQQYCYDDRLERTIRVYCPEYAEHYHKALGGMVEKRMRDTVIALGSIWYSAWVDAGQPDFNGKYKIELDEKDKKALEELDKVSRSGNIYGREHN